MNNDRFGKSILILVFGVGVNIWLMSAAFAEEKVVYTKICNGFWQIWEMDIAKAQARPLTDSQVDKTYPDWSFDGTKIAYTTATGELWIRDISRKADFKVPLNIPASQPKWSKDGKAILFMSPKNIFQDDVDIWRVDIDGKNLKKITKRPWVQTNPCWLANEEEILFVDSPEILGDEICRINIKSGDIIRLTQNEFNDIQPSYSSSEDKIVYSCNQGGNYNIWIMDKFGQNRRNLTNDSSCNIMPKLSMDGKSVYFLSDRNGFFQIFSIDLKTNQLRQITNDALDIKDFAIYAK